jgi:hypothetical protein
MMPGEPHERALATLRNSHAVTMAEPIAGDTAQ